MIEEMHKRMHSRMLTVNAKNAIMYDKHCLDEYKFLQMQINYIMKNLNGSFKDQDDRTTLD